MNFRIGSTHIPCATSYAASARVADSHFKVDPAATGSGLGRYDEHEHAYLRCLRVPCGYSSACAHLGGVHEGMLASVNERKHGGDCSKLDMHLLPH